MGILDSPVIKENDGRKDLEKFLGFELQQLDLQIEAENNAAKTEEAKAENNQSADTSQIQFKEEIPEKIDVGKEILVKSLVDYLIGKDKGVEMSPSQIKATVMQELEGVIEEAIKAVRGQ